MVNIQLAAMSIFEGEYSWGRFFHIFLFVGIRSNGKQVFGLPCEYKCVCNNVVINGVIWLFADKAIIN